MFKPIVTLLIIILTISLIIRKYEYNPTVTNIVQVLTSTSAPTPTPTFTLPALPNSKILNNDYHVFQSFNNCGPAALSMALSHYGIYISQRELGLDLRPYQNPQGNNDDKSVTLAELAQKASEYNLIPFHRPNGNIELVKQFLAHDIPVITRTLLNENDDIGHFRVIKGFNNSNQQFLQDDSLQGPNLWYTYSQFSVLWKTFAYEYLVLVPPEKIHITNTILGENADELTAWNNAVESTRKELITNPNDMYTRFNLSVALFHVGDFQGSVSEFEKVESRLPFRTLWYQIEPIQAYYELGNYQRVFEITNKIINNQNRAFSELYVLRGQIYQKQGNLEAANNEFQKAKLYNKNLEFTQ